MGAALAYYALFSVAPLLLIAIAITGTFFGEQTARDSAAKTLENVMDPQSAQMIMDLIEHSQKPVKGIWGPILAGVILFWGALKVFFQMRTSLRIIWDLPHPKGSTLLGLLLGYALAIAMVLIVSLLLFTSVVVSTALAVALEVLRDKLPFLDSNWQWMEVSISLFFITVLLALIYRIMSGRKIRWTNVLYGSFIAAILFSIGKILLSLYFAYSNINSIYGAGGSLVIFLIWISYSAQIMIFGAELIQARRTREEWLYQQKSQSKT